jgi:hypothetical protein
MDTLLCEWVVFYSSREFGSLESTDRGIRWANKAAGFPEFCFSL